MKHIQQKLNHIASNVFLIENCDSDPGEWHCNFFFLDLPHLKLFEIHFKSIQSKNLKFFFQIQKHHSKKKSIWI